MAEIELDYAVPRPELAGYVTLFYRFQADVPFFEDVERADHAQLRFRLSPGEADYRFMDGTVQVAPPVHLIGATSGATRTRVAGPVRVFGMGLTPAGWSALVGSDASLTINRVLDGEKLFGAPVRAAASALAEATTTAAMTAIVAPLLQMLIGQCRMATLSFVGAVDSWLSGSPSPDLVALATATGLSRRQVERRCNRLYGVPPKLLARKYRALKAAVALAEHDDDPALLDSFYDQSHMIREIKQFTGLTPKRMREEPGLLAKLTIERRHALAGAVHPIISDT